MVDACVVAAWGTGDALHRDLTQRCSGDWVDQGARPIAPWLLEAEVQYALWREHRVGRIEHARLHQLAGYCRALPIVYKKLRRWDVVLGTAALLDQPATYDACYAALAASTGETHAPSIDPPRDRPWRLACQSSCWAGRRTHRANIGAGWAVV